MIQEARQKTDRCKFYRDLLVFFLCALVWCGTGFTWPVYGEDTEIFVQLGHSGDIGGGCVTSVAFSSDRMFALSGSRDKTLKLWDVSTGRAIRTFEGHSDGVNSVAYSPNGKLALSGSDDNTLKLWDIPTGKLIHTFEGHKNSVTSIAFSPNGKSILSGSEDRTIKLWNISTDKEIITLIGFENGEWIAITPEGYFNSSPAGGEHINVRKGLNVYGIDQFFEQFFNPTMVAQVLHGKEIKIVKNISEGLAPPPNVRIVSPKPEESFSKDSIQVSVLQRTWVAGLMKSASIITTKWSSKSQKGA